MSSRIEGVASAAPSPPDRLGQLATEIADEVRLVDASYSTALQHAIAAGHKLTEAKQLLKSDSTKRWLPWVEVNFPGTRNTATNYMRLAENEQHVVHFRSVHEALASLAKPRKPRAKSQPKRESDPTVTGKAAVSHHPEVVSWVREKTRAGWPRDRMVKASKEKTDGWPLANKELTNGGVSEVRAAIVAEDRVRKQQALPPAKRKATEGGKRTRQLHADKRAGVRDPDTDLWKMQVALSEAASLLERFDLPELTWTEEMQERLNEILYEIERHHDWCTRALDVVWAHMNDIGRQSTLHNMRKRRDESPNAFERKAAAALVEKFEKKYKQQKALGEGA